MTEPMKDLAASLGALIRADARSHALEEAIDVCRRVGAEKSYLTHLSHMLPRHAELTEELSALPFFLQPAYDGLTVSF